MLMQPQWVMWGFGPPAHIIGVCPLLLFDLIMEPNFYLMKEFLGL